MTSFLDLMGNNIKLWFRWYWLMVDFYGSADDIKYKIQQICQHNYIVLESSKGEYIIQNNKYYWDIVHKRKCTLCNYSEEGADNPLYHKNIDMMCENNIVSVEMNCADQFTGKLSNTMAEIRSVSLDDYDSFDSFKCRSFSNNFLNNEILFWSHNRDELKTESSYQYERQKLIKWALSISSTTKEFLKALKLKAYK